MVFESLVVDLINKYLGDYVERLDTSQLQIGLLGGNAKLENLDIKANAFDDLDLPVKVLQGHIGKLTLKIPFKHLYSEPVIAELEGLYILVVPNAAVSYNDEKERKYKLESKLKELRKIEDAKEREAERSGKAKEDKKDSFGEKLMAQVIKNLQIQIKSIHVRYEDSYTNPKMPFSMGITLHNLSFQTTDSSGTPITIKDESTKEFYKSVKLECLAVYWNPKSKFYGSQTRGPLKNFMRSSISSPDGENKDFTYLVRPISSSAMMHVHMRPESVDFVMPQLGLDLNFNEIKLAIDRSQFNDITSFLDVQDRAWTQNKYRKYRPAIPIKGNYRIWWRYPYNVILEETVRRRRRMWSWEHISRHRRLCRQYISLWERKMLNQKLTADDNRMMAIAEEELDILNLTMCRRQAELQAARKKEAQKSKKSKDAKGGGGGWFGGWFGNKSGGDAAAGGAADITKKLQAEITTEEKEKLFQAIGYSEQGANIDFPKTYVSMRISAKLHRFGFTLTDHQLGEPTIVKFLVSTMSADVEQRTGANAIKVVAHVDSLTVTGVKQGAGLLPTLISSQVVRPGAHLLDFSFETNPLEGGCDQRVRVQAEPLEIIYDSETINQIVKFVTPPEELRLNELSATVLASLEDVKEMTATGLKHLASERLYTDIHVDVMPSYFILPEQGSYKPGCRLLLVDLGSVEIDSEPTARESLDNKEMDYEKIKEAAYDKFKIKLSSMQLLMIEKDEDWKKIRQETNSNNHIVRPFGFEFNLKKCIIANDPNLPMIAVDGCLPILGLDISDYMLKSLLELVLHVPFPEGGKGEDKSMEESVKEVKTKKGKHRKHNHKKGPETELEVRDYTATQIMRSVQQIGDSECSSDEDEFEDAVDSMGSPKKKKKAEVNLTDVDVIFVIKSIVVRVFERASQDDTGREIINLSMQDIGTSFTKRSWDQEIQAYLGSVALSVPPYQHSPGQSVCLIRTRQAGQGQNLLFVKLLIALKSAPTFLTDYKNTRHKLTCEFKTLEVCLHQEALLLVMNYANTLIPALSPPAPEGAKPNWADKVGDPIKVPEPAVVDSPGKLSAIGKIEKIEEGKRMRRAERLQRAREEESKEEAIAQQGGQVTIPEVSIIQWMVTASMEKVQVVVCSEALNMTEIAMLGMRADVQVSYRITEVALSLSDIRVTDSLEDTLYKKILWIEPNESIFTMQMAMYKESTTLPCNQFDLSKVDMSIAMQVGKIKVIFLYAYIDRLLKFLANFQEATDAAAQKAQEISEATVHQTTKIFKPRVKVQQAMETPSASRMTLDIKVQAPKVYMPQTSKSTNALMVDLGHLRLSNRFEMAPENSKAILEVTDIKLTNLRVSRTILIDHSEKSENFMVLPINVVVEMKRNLSVGWYTKVPNIDINATMKAITMGMSQGDYQMMLETLQQNFAEANSDTVDASASPKPQATPSSKPGEVDKPTSDTPVIVSGAGEEKKKEDKVWIAAAFKFTMEKVSLELFKGEAALGDWTASIPVSRHLARVEMSGLSLGGAMLTDSSMDMMVCLDNCMLMDPRVGSEKKINKILDTKNPTDGSTQKPALLNVTFKQDKQLNKHLDVNVCSVSVCVCVEYLMSIAEFFTGSQPQEVKKPIEKRQEKKPKKKATPAIVEKRTFEFDLRAKIQRPEIVLVEDMDSTDTNAIVLTTELQFNLFQKLECDIIDARVNQLQIFSCPFDEKLRAKYTMQIVTPCDLSLYATTPMGETMHGSLHMDSFLITVTPATIQTLSKISSSLTSAKPEIEDQEEHDRLCTVPDEFWKVKEFNPDDFAFIVAAKVPDVANDDDVVESGFDVASMLDEIDERRNQQVVVTIDKIRLILETEVGKKCVPMLVLESSLQGELKYPSQTSMSVSMNVELAMSYYNDFINEWEPLIETFPEQQDRRWCLGVEYFFSDDTQIFDEDDWTDLGTLQPAKTSIVISSRDTLEMTLSNTALDVLSNLGKTFTDAYHLTEVGGESTAVAPYIVRNQTGLGVALRFDENFQQPDGVDSKGEFKLASGKDIHVLDNIPAESMIDRRTTIALAKGRETHRIWFSLDNGPERELLITKSEVRIFPIYVAGESKKRHRELLVEVSAFLGSKTVEFRSVVQLENSTDETMSIFYMKETEDSASSESSTLDNAQHLTDLEPGTKFNVPMNVLYNKTGDLYIKPTNGEFSLSSKGASWMNTSDKYQVLECKGEHSVSHFYSVSLKPQTALKEYTEDSYVKYYKMTIHVSVELHNQLPIPLNYSVPGSKGDIVPGGHDFLRSVCIIDSPVHMSFEYMGKEWVGKLELSLKTEPLSVLVFESRDGYAQITMDLGVHYLLKEGYAYVAVYSPYWMLNKTGLPLTYKAGDDYVVEHKPDFEGAMLFSFRARSIFGKKKGAMKKSESSEANLKVCDSQWSSDKFSLDTVGNSSKTSCKTKNAVSYEVGVGISLSSSGLTKIVTFMPYFMIINKSPLAMKCHELCEGSEWLDAPPGEAVPFWPRNIAGKNMLMRVKVVDSKEKLVTQPFPFYESHSILMKLDKKYAGVFVEVRTTEEATLIILQEYQEGMALVQIINHLGDVDIYFHQGDINSTNKVPPGQMTFYAWEDPRRKREIVWQTSLEKKAKTFHNSLTMDGINEFTAGNAKAYWVSFMYNTQRVLLFTNDANIAKMARLSAELEPIEQEIALDLQALGLSLVHNKWKQEIAYVSVTSSGVKWNQVKRKSIGTQVLKPLKIAVSNQIEAAYETYHTHMRLGKNPKDVVTLEGGYEVDLSKSMLTKPDRVDIVKTYEAGVYIQYKTSATQMQVHMRIFKIQIDDQMQDCTFPVVFAPFPPPKSVALDSGPKPLVEMSAVVSQVSTGVYRFKYFSVLIQEMQLKMDQGFINALLEFFAGSVSDVKEEDAFKLDYKMVDDKLIETAVIVNIVQGGQKNIYDSLHISPIKMHVSFSLTGSSGGDKKSALHSDVLNLFLQSVGIVLTDVQDVIFKLAYFEKQNAIITNQQLQGEILSHYKGQGIRQMYVLVLGLDVLGNPFGVIRGMAQGVEDLFYEPVKGAVIGPEEFAEGVALGVKSLLGHAVGGAAGAVSRITGTLGKGIAALTFDDDYQRKRREQMVRRPETLGAGLAQGGKGLVMGVFHGVTGIVTKPVEGAKKEGVEGFFKGMGKGLVGVVTRPVSGVVDFASSSFEGIRRVADVGQEVARIRPPRYISASGIIRPYARREAEGHNVLLNVDKGKYAESDEYDIHVYTKQAKKVLVLTNKRIMFIDRNDLLATWSCEWQLQFGELNGYPQVTDKGLLITTKEKQKKLFHSSHVTKDVEMDQQVAQFMVARITKAMKLAVT